MATKEHQVRVIIGTAAELAAEAPVLAAGEFAIESDTGVLSLGVGAGTAYGASLLRVTLT